MATESKTITVGNGVSNAAWGYDFGPPFGSPYGSIDVAASQAFGGADVRAVSWLTSNSGTFSINLVGDARSAGFTQAVVNGTTFTLASADNIEYIPSNFYGSFTTYEWNPVSNPITTTVGATNSVVFTYDERYGFEVRNSSGILTTKASSRQPRIQTAGSRTITLGSSAGTYYSSNITGLSGLTGSDIEILLYYKFTWSNIALSSEVVNSTTFRIKGVLSNNITGLVAHTIGWIVLRN